MNRRILVAEDEADIAGVLADYLQAEGWQPELVADGARALELALTRPPALLLLDLNLPGLDGLEVLRSLRRHSQVPVVVVTARVEELDRLLGLELGADDYVCKPFSPREVMVRIKTVLRRAGAAPAGPSLGLSVDPAQWQARLDGRALDLTRTEFLLLATLARWPGRVYSRSQLLQAAWTGEADASERTVDSHVRNLRRKLAAADPGHEWIRSVYGVGFCLEPRVDRFTGTA